jgi:hypothetical protein
MNCGGLTPSKGRARVPCHVRVRAMHAAFASTDGHQNISKKKLAHSHPRSLLMEEEAVSHGRWEKEKDISNPRENNMIELFGKCEKKDCKSESMALKHGILGINALPGGTNHLGKARLHATRGWAVTGETKRNERLQTYGHAH